MDTISESRVGGMAASWGETVAGLLPVLTLSLATTIEGTSAQSWLSFLPMYIFILLLYALPAIGVPLAVKGGIPRWSSPYLALLVVDLMLLPIIFSSQMGRSLGMGMMVLGIAGILLMLFGGYRVVIALVKTPDRTIARTDNDWSQILFGIQTLTPFYLIVVFDEIDTAFKNPFIILNGLILAAGALVYLRARGRWLRLAALVGSVLLVGLLANNIARYYWSTHPWG